MVPTIKVMTFVKAFRTGRTCPCLMICEDANGDGIEVVVKLRTGSESSCTGLICELVASLLARDLDLPVPDPFLVDVDADFHEGIADADIAQRFQTSAGLNFGSRYLGPAFASWPQLRRVPSAMRQVAADVFAFDLIVQNPDRRQEKPNLLCKDDHLVIFDHELAFSFLRAIVPDDYPWDGKGMAFAANHIFYRELKGKDVSWDRLQGAFEAVDGKRIAMYSDGVPLAWRQESGDATARIMNYLELATQNSKALFRKIREVLI